MIRRILFITMVLVNAGAQASVTKVGNGDDGGDLEALTLIKSGPLLETRTLAVNRVKALNVAGIPGLGQLIPEIERSDMMMAARDSHPTGEAAGTLEISDDKSLVYARTFAEPYAVTRFFPAALTLTSEQMIALHIHEALHRSLPANIRENENVVMHITMALTSPGANFDRVWQVTRLYVRNAPVVADLEGEGENTMSNRSSSSALRELPKTSSSKVLVQYDSYENTQFSGDFKDNALTQMQGIEFATSLGGFRSLGSTAIEPYFRARLKTLGPPGEVSSALGPSSYDLAARMRTQSGALFSVFTRFTAKSLDEFQRFSYDRDIWTLGLTHQKLAGRGYWESQIFYSFASEVRNFSYSNESMSGSGSTEYKPILSLATRGGWAIGRWRLGGLAEIHASQGQRGHRSGMVFYEDGGAKFDYELRVDPFRLLVLGPELGFEGQAFQGKIYYKQLINGVTRDLTDLGDLMDRGANSMGYGVSFAALF